MALINARSQASKYLKRARIQYTLSRRRRTIHRRRRELQTDFAIKNNKRPAFSKFGRPVSVPCFISSRNEILTTDDEKKLAIFDHFEDAFNDLESMLDLVPDWVERR